MDRGRQIAGLALVAALGVAAVAIALHVASDEQGEHRAVRVGVDLPAALDQESREQPTSGGGDLVGARRSRLPAPAPTTSPADLRSLTEAEVKLLLPALEETECNAEARRYQQLEAYGERSVDHVAARWEHFKAALLLDGVRAGRGRRVATPEQIWEATHHPPDGQACIAGHLCGMDLIVMVDGTEAREWRAASREVEQAMVRIAPPPMTARNPPGWSPAAATRPHR